MLEEIAAMLELAGENPFKVRAYENGAKALSRFRATSRPPSRSRRAPEDPRASGRPLRQHRDPGPTGSLPYYDELRARFSSGAPGVPEDPGSRRAQGQAASRGARRRLARDASRRSCREGKLAAVKGFGPRSVEKILQGIALVLRAPATTATGRARRAPKRSSRPRARPAPPPRSRSPGASAGASEIVRNIDLVAASIEPERLGEAFRGIPASRIVGRGPGELLRALARRLDRQPRDRARGGVPRGSPRLHRLGRSMSRQLRERAKRLGLEALRDGPLPGEGARLPAASEAEIYAALGLAYVEPELREGRGEIEASVRGELPTSRRGTGPARPDPRPHDLDPTAATLWKRWSRRRATPATPYAGDHGPQQERRLRRGPRRGARAGAARRDPRAAAAAFPDFRIFHGTGGRHPRGRIDRLRRRVPAGLRSRRGVHSLRFGLSREEQTRAARARGPQSAGLGARASDRPASFSPATGSPWTSMRSSTRRRSRVAPWRSTARHRALDLDWRFCRKRGRQGRDAGDRPRRTLRRRARPHLPGRRDCPQGLGHAEAAALNAKSADELDGVARAPARRAAAIAG